MGIRKSEIKGILFEGFAVSAYLIVIFAAAVIIMV